MERDRECESKRFRVGVEGSGTSRLVGVFVLVSGVVERTRDSTDRADLNFFGDVLVEELELDVWERAGYRDTDAGTVEVERSLAEDAWLRGRLGVLGVCERAIRIEDDAGIVIAFLRSSRGLCLGER